MGPGTYVLSDFFADPNAPPGGTLTITAVPELSTWAMMLLGFAAVGFAAYSRTSAQAVLVGPADRQLMG